MSDRIDEYHGADDTAYTTAEVESWFDCSIRVEHGKLLATTRALETAQAALTIAASRSAKEDEARTGYVSLMGKFYEHLELMIRYLEEETSHGDGIAEEHHDGYRAAKALVERTEGLDGLWERAQIAVHELKLELDNALHTFRCIEEDERYQAVVARAEKAEAERDAAVAELSSSSFARDRYANTIGLIESAIGFSGASPVDETIERVRRLKAERDDGAARDEKAERERDETMARVAELERLVEAIVCYWYADSEGQIDPDLIDAGRAALAKAKGATNG